jgi:nucleoside-diphosphate-sugar epimerase
MSAFLVTGATGFTGSNLCRRLVAAGGQVIGLVRPGTDTSRLEALGVECRRADLTDGPAVRAAFHGISRVYHLAAAYRQEHADRTEFYRVNVEATRLLLELSREAGVQRFVHCSTVGVQGQIDNPPATEEYRLAPGDHYQESKLEGERLALEYARGGLPLTVVRPVGIYGPGDLRFLKLFREIDRGRFIMIGTGKTLYHLTFIDDLIDGIVRAADSEIAVGEVFTIAGPRFTTLKELVSLIARTLRKPPPRLRIPYSPVYLAAVLCERVCRWARVAPPLYPRRVEFFSKDRAFDIGKARRLLGYQPAVDLEEGLRRTVDWYRETGRLPAR